MIMGTLSSLMAQKCGCIDMAIIYHLGIKKGSTTWTVPIYDNKAEAGSAYSYIKYGGKSGYIPLCSTSDSRATGGRVKEHTGSEFAIAISGAPPYTKKTYSNPGTYSFTVPAGVTKLRCEIAGAGGGGGSGKYWYGSDDSDLNEYGNAGGKGGNGNKWNGTFTVSPGNTITITVGSGGAGGSKPTVNLSNKGSSGGSSSCNGTTSGGGAGGKGGTSSGAGTAGANSGNGKGGAGGAGGAGNSGKRGAGSRGNNGWVIIEYGMGVQ